MARTATGIVAALTGAYAALVGRWIVAPLGLSHDGRNTAMFALGSRAMERLGVVDSRAGAVLADGNGSYSHHPPSLVWAVRVSQAAFGDAPWAARLPTFLASVAVIWLLYGLLGDLGLRPIAAAVGTTVAVANPMFLLFVWMTDTPMWSLPFALVATRVWVRAGSRPPSRRALVVAAIAAAICALSGWQSVVWCGLLAVAGWPGRRLVVRSLVGGTVAGLALTCAWIVASPEGLAGLLDSFSTRAAGTGQGLGVADAVAANWAYVRELWSPLVVAVGLSALWLAWRDVRVRRLLVVAVVGVVGYACLFWEAAGFHSYWNSWAVVAVALAFGAAADALMVSRRAAVAMVVVAVAALALAPLQPSDSRAQLEQGIELGRVVAGTPLPADQPGWLLSALSGSETWISYVSDRPVRVVSERSELLVLARRHPDWMMVLPCEFGGTDTCAAMGRNGAVVNGVAVNRLAAVIVGLP